jgi:hypothetical protein
MLFFLLHLRQVNTGGSWEEDEVKSRQDYPWIACFRGRLSGAVTYGCLIGLPIGSSLLLLFKHGELGEDTTWWGAGLTLLLIVVGGFATHAIHKFREHLRGGDTRGETVPSDPVKAK